MYNKEKNKRGQVTIFIIIAIVIVAGVVIFFSFKNNIIGVNIPQDFQPVYSSLLSCIQDNAETGISLLESHGGYIYLPEFEPGSRYMPFSSQLNFLGDPIPYWYYVSGNNIEKEQVPSKTTMEKNLARFIKEKINTCNFNNYYQQGFKIVEGEPKVDVSIENNKVKVDVNMDFSVSRGEDSVFFKNHEVEVKSNLGELYDSAIKIYNKENEEMFLENYGVDVLRLYAPVDGVEMTCSPLVWNAEDVFNELQNALVQNTLSLKNKHGSYKLNKKEDKYFLVDLGVDKNVRFLTSKNWPNSFEVNPSKGPVMIANPVGNQPGLGILGFCYVPYHFVYDISYPVLVQVYDNPEEVFQFPVAVVIKGNMPRKPLENAQAVKGPEPELCNYRNTPMDVNVYDTSLKPVDAEISFECFGTLCDIGKTRNGNLQENFPQCINGYVIAEADGYQTEKEIASTNTPGSIDLILNKLHKLNVILKLNNEISNQRAIINFVSNKTSKTIVYPDTKEVELAAGQYEISVFVYDNSSINIQGSSYEQCVEVPKSGVGGIFGLTEEKCFNVNLPSQVVSNALIGGGKQKYYILESDLTNNKIIEINAHKFAKPKTLDDLQKNYELLEGSDLDILFK